MIGYKRDPIPGRCVVEIDRMDRFFRYGTYLEVHEVLDGKREGDMSKLIEKNNYGKRESCLLKLVKIPVKPVEKWISGIEKLFSDEDDMGFELCSIFSPISDEKKDQFNLLGLRCVSLNNLSDFFYSLLEFNLFRKDENKEYRNDSNDGLDDITKAIRDAGVKEDTALTPQAIYELLLFGCLFAYFKDAPSDDDIEHLRKNLEQYSVARRITSNEEIKISPARFVCYQKQEKNIPLNLEIRTLHNKMDVRATVIVDGSPLQRSIAPGEKLAVLCVDGAVVAFMPRICVVEDCVITQKELLEMNNSGSEGSSLAAFSENSVLCFSESDKYGLMVTDENGKFISQNQFVGDIPEKDICWMKGDLEDYGFVMSDGTYTGRIRRTKWENILFFDLSGGNGIAVTAQRTAIDNDGRVLCEDVAAVSCCGKRYIILKMDGSVVTDQKTDNMEGPIRVVCADESGYWISTDKAMFHGASEKEFVPADEIMRNHVGSAVFFLDTDGKVMSLS